MDVFILHVETATKICSVALSKNGTLVQTKETDESDYVHGEVLTLFIEEVLAKSGISAKHLSAVSVTSGPGSYTGLRIGVSTAKGLCYALNIPLISIDALLNLAIIANKNHLSTSICAMIDARRMEVFSAIFDSNLSILKPISADILDEETYKTFEPFVVVGDGSQKVQDIWSSRNLTTDFNVKSSAIGHVSIAYQKFLNQEFEDVAYFEPFYLKDFVSTQKK